MGNSNNDEDKAYEIVLNMLLHDYMMSVMIIEMNFTLFPVYPLTTIVPLGVGDGVSFTSQLL
jgi:hypothetical protein